MLDNQIYQILFPIIDNGLVALGIAGVTVLQGNQPTQQGAVSTPAVYLYKVSNHSYGFPRVNSAWTGSQEQQTQEQWDEATFQASALITQNPADTSALTASDLLNAVRSILQFDQTLDTLKANGLGILRVDTVPNPFFKDDRDNFEAAPSIDFVITNTSQYVGTVPVVPSVEFNVNRV